jgi:Bacterial extracellular solute-binding protein
VLSDITARAHALAYIRQFDGAHMGNANYKGRLYALPFSGDASVLFYNTDLFRAAGISRPPRTWAEMPLRLLLLRRLRRLRDLHVHAARLASGGRILAGPPEHQRPTLVGNRPLAVK